MSVHPKSLVLAGVVLGVISWLAIPIFLPLLMMGEASTGKSIPAFFFVLTGPALILPLTLLGLRNPRKSSRLFFVSAVVNFFVILLWIKPERNHNPIMDIDDVFGVIVSLLIPGPLLLFLFSHLLRRMKLPDASGMIVDAPRAENDGGHNS